MSHFRTLFEELACESEFTRRLRGCILRALHCFGLPSTADNSPGVRER